MTAITQRILTCAFALLFVTTLQADEYETLFNGKDLTGWKGKEGLWSVQDGVIVGESTAEKKVDPNTFLVWQGGDVADFEFTAAVRFKGNNTGVQYRSKPVGENPVELMGYQMDLHPSASFYGMLYGEKYGTRGKIATRGQQIEITADGTVKQLGKVGNDDKFTDWEWNKIRIIAVGSRLIHQVNGVTTIDVNDHHKDAMTSGVLGLQLHKGGPMRVEFKDLKLRSSMRPRDSNCSRRLSRKNRRQLLGKPTNPRPRLGKRGQPRKAKPQLQFLPRNPPKK